MRVRHILSGLVLLVLSVSCRDKEDAKQQALAQAASAQAVGHASSAQAQAKDQAASAQAMASALAAQVDVPASVTGNVHSVGGQLGTWDITLDKCASGEVEGFFGVDFSAPGSDDLRLRYVHDEGEGDIVKVVYPTKKDTARAFDRDDKCAVLEGHVEKTNITTWTPKGKIRHVKGHVKFDCKTDGGGHIKGEATFSDCH
jgi:hypothetical protein